MMLALAVVVAPGARAYSKATWQAAFAGTFVFPGALIGVPGGAASGGFWGWCDFVGLTAGTAGDCEVSNYMNIAFPSSSLGVVTVACLLAINVDGWTTGTFDTFTVNSGSVTVSPSSTECIALVTGMGLPVGTITAPLDTHIPVAAGHFNTNQAIFALPGQFQMTVTQVFTT